MKLLETYQDKIVTEFTENEFFIFRAIISEIYAGVCVDSYEFEVIHGIKPEDVYKLEKEANEIYDTWKLK